MQLLPETTLGNFFNTQHRDADHASADPDGVGIARRARRPAPVQGRRRSAAQQLRRHERQPAGADRAHRTARWRAGSISSGPTAQIARQHRRRAVRPGSRASRTRAGHLEFGARLDRDGIIGRWNVTPRVGAARAAERRGQLGAARRLRPVLRADAVDGRRVRRSSRPPTDTRFAADGVTPLGPPVPFAHGSTGDLETPRSRTWDVGYDHRFNDALVGACQLARPRRQPRADASIRCRPATSRRAAAVEHRPLAAIATPRSAFISPTAAGVDLNASYARSTARGDLNSLDQLLRHDDVAGRRRRTRTRRLAADVPHRLLARGRAAADADAGCCSASPTGAPACRTRRSTRRSISSARATSSGSRPTSRLDLGIEHRFKIFKLQPWIGVRAYNAFDSFLPTDVQANISSPVFGIVLQLGVPPVPAAAALRALTRAAAASRDCGCGRCVLAHLARAPTVVPTIEHARAGGGCRSRESEAGRATIGSSRSRRKTFDRSIDFLRPARERKGSGPNIHISLALAYVDKVPTAGDIRRLYLGRDAMAALTKSIERRRRAGLLPARRHQPLLQPVHLQPRRARHRRSRTGAPPGLGRHARAAGPPRVCLDRRRSCQAGQCAEGARDLVGRAGEISGRSRSSRSGSRQAPMSTTS